MKIPWILASDFSGFVPGMLFYGIGIVLVPVVIITLFAVFRRKEQVGNALRVGRYLAGTQVVALGWYCLVRLDHVRGDGFLGTVVVFLIPSFLVWVAPFVLGGRKVELTRPYDGDQTKVQSASANPSSGSSK